jgi:hypothetical protein
MIRQYQDSYQRLGLSMADAEIGFGVKRCLLETNLCEKKGLNQE